METVVIIGLGSDIGREIGARFAAQGWSVKGTHRAGPPAIPGAESVHCDLASGESVARAAAWLEERCAGWRLVVVAAGTEEPVGTFWECDGDEWDRGIAVNTLAPLRLVRALYGVRGKAAPAVAFFSGSGTNNAAPAYSAYAASKIMLIKMCELLDAESGDTSFFIIGPGIVRTKIHEETLRASDRAGKNLARVREFLASAEPGTGHDEIFDCLRWCMEAGKQAVGGRNLSLVHDAWRGARGRDLAQWLEEDPNRYKLRRSGNEHRFRGEK